MTGPGVCGYMHRRQVKHTRFEKSKSRSKSKIESSSQSSSQISSQLSNLVSSNLKHETRFDQNDEICDEISVFCMYMYESRHKSRKNPVIIGCKTPRIQRKKLQIPLNSFKRIPSKGIVWTFFDDEVPLIVYFKTPNSFKFIFFIILISIWIKTKRNLEKSARRFLFMHRVWERKKERKKEKKWFWC